MPPHSAEFDIDDPARAGFHRTNRLPLIINTLVKAQGGTQLTLQARMRMNIVPLQWLLDHQQPELIEPPKVLAVAKTVGGIRIDGEQDVFEFRPNGGDEIEILAGLDFEFDALVSASQFFGDLADQRCRCLADAE